MICTFKVINICQLIYFKTLRISAIKYKNLTLLVFLFIGLAALKKTKAELEILTEISALMIEKGIIGGTCHGIP